MSCEEREWRNRIREDLKKILVDYCRDTDRVVDRLMKALEEYGV
jgi:hypothetical protein